jgi:polyvinyl alcohol dehydrogenase (cytochrome)
MHAVSRVSARRNPTGRLESHLPAGRRLRQIAARLAALCLLFTVAGGEAWGQPADGAQIFQRSCATCHNGAPESRAPSLESLRSRTPQAVIESLVTGAMRPQGARMSGAERRAVAEFVTGKAVGGDVRGAETGRCPATMAPAVKTSSSWTGWSPTATNTRFQSGDRARLPAADVPRLTVKWALGFPDASVAWGHPTVAAGRVFVGSQNGTVYSLDAKSGCIHWTYGAAGGVRTAIVWDGAGAAQGVVYFGDTAANVHAVDVLSGAAVWVRRIDEHPLARVTGSPAVHEGRVYVGLSSYEEAQGADPQYGCCTFRGSLVALAAKDGNVIWKTYTIAEEPKPRGTSTAGVTLYGPAGAAIWSAPTIDPARGAIYVATGNMYSGPAQPASNAVLAFALATGTIRWMRQATPGDVYLTGCRAGNPNCPATNGPDHDFGSPPMLTRAGGRDLLVIGQKSGIAFAMDPDKAGEIVWQYRAGQGGVLGGIEWGAAADGQRAYFAVSDMTSPQPGGLHAVSLATGERVWYTAPGKPVCGTGRGCSAAQSAAVTGIPEVLFSGANDGALRAYSTANGAILWEFDTNREFPSVNGIPARGASIQGPGAAVADGMVYVNSGYGAFGGRPGNVLLAFGVP